MKRTLLLLTMLTALCAIPANAQEHLTFENIPICGNIHDFTAALQQKDWRLEGAHYSNEKIEVYLTNKRGNYLLEATVGVNADKNVTDLTVLRPTTRSWDKIHTEYLSLKDKLDRTYGEARKTEENIDNTLRNPIDGLSPGTTTLRVVYVTREGIISLTVIPSGKGARTALSYQDNPWTTYSLKDL